MICSSKSDLSVVDSLEFQGGSNQAILSDKDPILGGPPCHSEDANNRLHDTSANNIPSTPYHIPPEILEYIFEFLPLPGKEPSHKLTLPPVCSQFPWVLGRVCSVWRHLSRSMRKLWGTCVFNLGNSNDAKVVRRAIDILPEVANVSVAIYPIDILGFIKVKDALIPLLSRIDELNWLMHQQLWPLLPSQAFSQLSSLQLEIQDRERHNTTATQTLGLFGEASRLKNLTICSQFQLPELDYPWHQLTSLSLIFNGTYFMPFGELTRQIWNQLFNRLCLGCGPSLRQLKLDLRDNMLLDFMSLQFPWQQLTRFHVFCRSDEGFLRTIQVIQKCSTLIDLGLFIKCTLIANDPVIFQSLEILHLDILPSCLVQSPSIWSDLLELHIDSIQSLPDFFAIGQQCRRLEKFSGSLWEPSIENIRDMKETIFPHLRDLRLVVRGTLIFNLLRTPALSALTVRVMITPCQILQVLSHYLIRSECRLDSFELHQESSYHDHFKDKTVFRALFSSLTHCTYFYVSGMLPIPAPVLHDIASGILLPRLECIRMETYTSTSFLAMVERRLEVEAARGRVRLRDITGYLTSEEPDSGMLTRRLREMEKKYNVSVRSC